MSNTSKPGKKMGRPPEAVPAGHADALIEWIATGKTLRQWCRENRVHYSTVYLWMEKDEGFAQRIARARETGYDAIADECVEIADEAPPVDANGRVDAGHVSWQKNRVWTRTQLLAKWSPKKYGDKRQLEHSGDMNFTIVSEFDD